MFPPGPEPTFSRVPLNPGVARRNPPGRRQRSRIAGLAMPALIFAALLHPAQGEDRDSKQTNFSKGADFFPKFYAPFQRRSVGEPELVDSEALLGLVQGGQIQLSLSETVNAVVENNLDLALQRYDRSIAETDLLRAKSGQAPRGLNGAPIPPSLFTTVLGAGIGQGGGGGGGGGPAISGGGRSISIPPLGTFDPILTFDFSVDRTEAPLNTVRVAGVPLVVTHTTAYQIGYQQAFSTGTGFSLTFSGTRQSSTQRFLRFNPSVSNTFSFALTQRLLNGFGSTINRRFIDVAENNQILVRENFRQSLIEILAQAETQYWELVAQRENVRNAEKVLSAAQKLLEDSRTRFEAGTVARVEVISAQSEVAARRRDLILAQTEYQNQGLALKNLFSKELGFALSEAAVVPTETLPQPEASDIPSVWEAEALAMKNRPELRQVEQSLRNSEVAVRFTKDSLKPSLNFFALFVSRGLFGDRLIPDPEGGPPFEFSGGFEQSFRQVRKADFPEYAFGITLTIPIQNRRAQADDIRARLEKRRQENSQQRLKNQIKVEIRRAVAGLVQGKAEVEAARETVRLAQETLRAEQAKFAAGVTTTYQVVLVERDLLAAQTSLVQALADFAKAEVELSRATGTTLLRLNVELEDAMQLRSSDKTAQAAQERTP